MSKMHRCGLYKEAPTQFQTVLRGFQDELVQFLQHLSRQQSAYMAFSDTLFAVADKCTTVLTINSVIGSISTRTFLSGAPANCQDKFLEGYSKHL